MLFLPYPGDDFARDLFRRHVLFDARLALLLGQADRNETQARIAAVAAFARCNAGMTVFILAMPTCGLLRGSGRKPVAQPNAAGGAVHTETWWRPPSIRSSTSKLPSSRTAIRSTP